MWSKEVLSRIRSHRPVKSVKPLYTSPPITFSAGRGPLSLRSLEKKAEYQRLAASADVTKEKGVSKVGTTCIDKSSASTVTASSPPSQDLSRGLNKGRIFLGVAGGLGMTSGGFFARSQLTTGDREQRQALLGKHLRVAVERRARLGTINGVMPVE